MAQVGEQFAKHEESVSEQYFDNHPSWEKQEKEEICNDLSTNIKVKEFSSSSACSPPSMDWNNNNNSSSGVKMNVVRFRATGTAVAPVMQSPPCLTIPPGISPAELLDSPIMLPNAQAQLSPTTGTFQFPSCESLMDLQTAESSSPQSDPSHWQIAQQQTTRNLNIRRDAKKGLKRKLSTSTPAESEVTDNKSQDAECPSLQPSKTTTEGDRKENDNMEKAANFPKEISRNSDDGYNWRKYGQKHVKGSEYPRSYFKCTNTNCPVTKKVEHSHDGQIAEIVYKGTHNHPKPQPVRRYGDVSQVNKGDGSYNMRNDHGGTVCGNVMMNGYGSDWRPRNFDNLHRNSFFSDFPDELSKSMYLFQPTGNVLPNQDHGDSDGDGDDEAMQDSISFDDGEAKRRKREIFSTEATISSRSTREPRVVVQIESEIDILDDGYRWRKYGQKVVKGNPNPRSYYKCTTPGCTVRKHVERAANNLKSVITSYEGKHNHEVPSSRNGSLIISNVANLPAAVTNSTSPLVSSSLSHNLIIDGSKSNAMHLQDLPLYFESKPVLSDHGFVRSNFLGDFVSDMNFRPSPLFSFPALPYSHLLMNANPDMVIPDSTSTTFPMINQLPEAEDNASLSNFHFNNNNVYVISQDGANIQSSFQGEFQRMVKPKEELKDDYNDMYDHACLSITNYDENAASSSTGLCHAAENFQS